MNILFLTLIDFATINDRNIYTDLMREFIRNGHTVHIISPIEKRKQQSTKLINGESFKILKLQIGNMQKTNLIEKGISTLTLESKFKKGIKKYFNNIKYELVIYSTPPITLQKAVGYVKTRDKARAYLLLKDIFPQNAVDLGMIRSSGIGGFIYKYFRLKEKKLYKLSDYIGCMSEANVSYLLKNNSELTPEIVEVCPNSIEPLIIKKDIKEIRAIRGKYNIPNDKTIFIYGGNLGKPQGIEFLIKCLKANRKSENVYFIIAGSGTEYKKLKSYFDIEKPINAQLFSQLSKEDYDLLASSCDVGLIFLDIRFTIPNFPSRMLSYMQASMPVIAATDINTDIGQVIENGNFGYWCESGDIEKFNKLINVLCNYELRKKMSANARKYLDDHYTAKHSYEVIIQHFY